MVLESVVVDLVNRFLGDFIENLDKSQLSIGIWGGDILLNNLFVKESLLNELDLPIRVTYGNIEQLKLKIPWKNLYTEPTVAILDGLYIIAVPNSSIKYDEEKETKAAWDFKQKELAQIEEAKKKAAEKLLPKDAAQDTFTEKLVTNVIKNLEVKITNIHVRYEDTFTNPQKPFSVGVTLREISCLTTDENWKVSVIKETAVLIYKMLKMDSLSLYWNVGDTTFAGKDRGAIQAFLKGSIAQTAKDTGYLYLIEPMSSVIHLRLNTKPEQDGFIKPKVLVDAVFEEIAIILSRCQYQILMEFLESFERMKLGSKYRKYRPNNTDQKNHSAWWRFAYKCVLEDTVRRRRAMWSWKNIKEHGTLCRHYRNIYKTRLLTTKPSNELLADLERCERKLDVFNITMMRHQAEMEVKKDGLSKKKEESEGWFSGWFSSGSSTTSPDDESKSVGEKVKDVMTPDEKQKLYNAIGYQENVDTVYPVEFVAVKLLVKLKSLQVKLQDTDSGMQEVLNLRLKDVCTDVAQRPAASAIRVNVSISTMKLSGLSTSVPATAPVLVSQGSKDFGALLDIVFETNPMDGLCDARVRVAAMPLQIVYDAKTINTLAEFFKPPEYVHVVQLQAAAMAKLEKVKQQTTTGLQYALEQQKFTDINIMLQPTYILVPEFGDYKPDCRMLLLDLGRLVVITEKQRGQSLSFESGDQSPKILSLEEIKQQAYDKFILHLQSLQLLYVSPGDNWMDARKSNGTPLHILRPMAINIDFFKSVLLDVKLPKMRISGELPTFSVSLSDRRLTEVLDLVNSIPFPQSSPAAVEEDEFDASLKVPDLKNLPIKEETAEFFATLTTLDESSVDGGSPQGRKKTSDFYNATDLELKFEVKEISLYILKHLNGNDIPTLSVTVESLGMQLKLCTFDTSLNAYLGAICIEHTQFKEIGDGPAIKLVNTPLVDEKNFKELLSIHILLAQKRHPEFQTLYENTLQKIVISFNKIDVLLHREALLNVIELVQMLQAATSKNKEKEERETKLARRLSRLSIASVSTAMRKIEPKKVFRRKTIVEPIEVALMASLSHLSISVCSHKRDLAEIEVIGLEAKIAVMKSQTFIEAALKDIDVYDPSADAIFPEILAFDGGGVFDLSIVVYNDSTQGANYTNPQCVDTKVTLSTGCMQVVFLNKFVQDLLNFLNQFQAAKDRITAAGSAVADKAAVAAQDLSQKASRLSLDIKLKAPVIIVPQNSKSANAVVIDLGKLRVTNSFQMLSRKDGSGLPAVLDCMVVDLTLMKIYRALVEGVNVKAECLIVSPVTLQVNVTRNLSSSWYNDHPDVEISGKLCNFSILLSQGDYTTIMRILNENLQESVTQDVTSPADASSGDEVKEEVLEITPAVPLAGGKRLELPVVEPYGQSKLEPQVPIDRSITPGIYSTLRAHFTIERIEMELFIGDSELTSGIGLRDGSKSLAKLQFLTVIFAADMKSDKSMSAAVSLKTLHLRDSRPARQSGITRLIGQSTNFSDQSNMADLTYEQDANLNKDVSMQVNGLYVLVCLEHLLKLSDFFVKGLPETKQPPATVTEVPKLEPGPNTTVPQPTVTVDAPGEMKVKFSLNRPEVVLVEDAMKPNTNALILDMQLDFEMSSCPTLQTMNGCISGLSVVSCTYSQSGKDTAQSQILSPIVVKLVSNAPRGKTHRIEVTVSDITLTVSASSLRIVTSTLSSLSVPQEESAEDELAKIPRDLWTVRATRDCQFWFLKQNLGGTVPGKVEGTAIENGTPISDKNSSPTSDRAASLISQSEELVLAHSLVIVKLMGGVDKSTIPFIITELCLNNVLVKNWSTKMNLSCQMSLEMAYYNEKLAAWEPLIEPVEAGDQKDRPWQLNVEVSQNPSVGSDESDSDSEAPSVALPQMSINVTSHDILEMTVTKTSLEVFKNLGQSFGEAYNLAESTLTVRENLEAPYVIKNESGMYLTIRLGDEFMFPADSDGTISVDPGQSLQLFDRSKAPEKLVVGLDNIYNDSRADLKAKKLHVVFDDLGEKRTLRVMKAEKRSFSINARGQIGNTWQLIAQFDTIFGCKIVTLRSAVQVHNSLPLPVEIYYKLCNDAMARCGQVDPDTTVSLPCDAVYAESSDIYFKPIGSAGSGSYLETSEGCEWKNRNGKDSSQLFECKGSADEIPSIYISAKVTVENVYHEYTTELSAKSYTISLLPTVVFRNLLPLPVVCKIEESTSVVRVEPGMKAPLLGAQPDKSAIAVSVLYQNCDWVGRYWIDSKPVTLTVLAFDSFANEERVTLDLSLHSDVSAGYMQLSLYSPYWMINKTGHDLMYKAGEDYVVKHEVDVDEAAFFLFKKSSSAADKKHHWENPYLSDPDASSLSSFRSDHLTSSNTSVSTVDSLSSATSLTVPKRRKKRLRRKCPIHRKVRASLKLDECSWSERFSLDTVGSVGSIKCDRNGQCSTVGVKITLSSSGLTKIITFTPFFVVKNEAKFAILFKEHMPGSVWTEVQPGDCIPFWPVQVAANKQLIACIKDTALETVPFSITESHATFLQLYHDYGGINVECQAMEGVITITFSHYHPGVAAVLIVNHSHSSTVEYHQKFREEQVLRLDAGECAFYTWHDPCSDRELIWSCGKSKDNKDELLKDGTGEIFVDDGHTKLYWISFLDGMQRVLLFTENCFIVTFLGQAGGLERIEKEIVLSLQGFGLSLVNNAVPKEVAYFAVTNSGIIWEQMKRKRFKAVKTKYNVVLEDGYQKYLAEIAANEKKPSRRAVDVKLEVDYGSSPMVMYKPHKVKVRRSFEYGIWLQHRTSKHQTQLHLKIHRLQLDNQLVGAVFPTVLAPVPPPKSVVADSVPKPFTELSVMIQKSQHSDVMQFKYCKLLIQEMAVKVDQGFLNSIIGLFSSGTVDEAQQLLAFRQECELINSSLTSYTISSSASDIKHFYDILHFSPLKVHLSFSLYGGDEVEGNQKPEIQWDILNLFLQSVGIVLTDIQDVIFKLAYFERTYSFYNQSQLMTEITRHYSQQAIKQMYVLVLGLDVLGNPFGVIRGLAEGIEDLFYEPYQGAIQGPEEFAEGLALGVKSLLGHAVGGAAGAVSRITGALGKGIATLTLDEEYQRKRREALNKRPADLKEGLARGGKGLVMGVVHGVTGVVTQPMEGAKKDGVSGFFKGMGKGIVGVFTRPASGVVDFASSSFEGIRRAAELSDEVQRVRPTRFIQTDGIIRPFVHQEAEGNQILLDVEKGKFASDLYLGHVAASGNSRTIFLATDKRVIFTVKGDIFGHWDSEWEFAWDLLREPPSLIPKGIQILLKEKQKKFFGSGSIGKVVTVLDKDRKEAEVLVNKMKIAMNAAV